MIDIVSSSNENAKFNTCENSSMWYNNYDIFIHCNMWISIIVDGELACSRPEEE